MARTDTSHRPEEPSPTARGGFSSVQRCVFLLCWITYAGYYLGRVNLAVALPAIQSQFGWSRASVGLIGTGLYWSYALGQLINGHLGDRLSARRLVAVGLAASALLNLLFGSLSLLPLMIIVWTLNGWAQSTGWAPMLRTLSRWFSPQQRPKLTAFFSPCYVVGHALSWGLAGWLISRGGWRPAFWVPGGVLLALAGLWYRLAQDAPEGAPQRHQGEPSGIRLDGVWHSVRDILGDNRLRWALWACFLVNMVRDGVTLWAPMYLVEEQGLSVASAALRGTMIPIAGVGGTWLAAWLAGRANTRGEGRAAMALGLAIAVALGLYQVGAGRIEVAALAMFLVAAAGAQGINALLTTSLPLSLGSGGRVSSTVGTLDCVSYIGSGLSAALVGILQDRFGWGAAFGLWALAALGVSFFAWRGSRAARLAPTAPISPAR